MAPDVYRRRSALASRTAMTIREAADFLRISLTIVAAAAKRGELPVIRRGNVLLIDGAALRSRLRQPAHITTTERKVDPWTRCS